MMIGLQTIPRSGSPLHSRASEGSSTNKLAHFANYEPSCKIDIPPLPQLRSNSAGSLDAGLIACILLLRSAGLGAAVEQNTSVNNYIKKRS